MPASVHEPGSRWSLPVYGANSTIRFNKAALRLTNSRVADIDAAYVPIWKSGSTMLKAVFSANVERVGSFIDFHSFEGRVGTAAIMAPGAVVLALVRDPVARFESMFRLLNSAFLQNATRHEQEESFFQFTDSVWRGVPMRYAEHVLTQMYFLTSTNFHGEVLPFRHIGKVEALNESLHRFGTALNLTQRLKPPRGCIACHVERSAERSISLAKTSPHALLRICAMYRQDFACLGYALPPVCTPANLRFLGLRPALRFHEEMPTVGGAVRLAR